MKISLNKNIEDSNLFYILIAFSCMNFLGRGSLLFLVFALFAFIKESHVIKVDGNFCCVALLTFSIALASLVFYDVTEVVKSLNYVLLYLAGHNGFMAAKDKLRFAKKTVFSVFAGFAVYVILTYLYNRNIELGGSRIIYMFGQKSLWQLRWSDFCHPLS